MMDLRDKVNRIEFPISFWKSGTTLGNDHQTIIFRSTLVILVINVRVVVESFPAFGKSAMDLRISTVSHFSSREIAVQFTPAIKTATVLPPTLQSRLKSYEKINVILSSGMLAHFHLLLSDFYKITVIVGPD